MTGHIEMQPPITETRSIFNPHGSEGDTNLSVRHRQRLAQGLHTIERSCSACTFDLDGLRRYDQRIGLGILRLQSGSQPDDVPGLVVVCNPKFKADLPGHITGQQFGVFKSRESPSGQ